MSNQLNRQFRGLGVLLVALACKLAPAAAFAAPRPIPPFLPTQGGLGLLAPWGGADESQWRAEAVLANASSVGLNTGWQAPGVTEVRVAIPVRLFSGNLFPYGDGQSNANPSFEGWKTKRPPLVAILTQFSDRKSEVTFKLDRAFSPLEKGYTHFEVRFKNKSTGEMSADVDARIVNGDLVGVWNDLPRALDWENTITDGVALVRPAPGFSDFFPVTFRVPVRDTAELVQDVKSQLSQGKSEETRKFLDRTLVPDRIGLKLSDSERILLSEKRILDEADPARSDKDRFVIQKIKDLVEFIRLDNPGLSESQRSSYRSKLENIVNDGMASVLKKALFYSDFPGIYNSNRAGIPFMPLNVHAEFPNSAQAITTGVGMGWTWVAEKDTPFKIMYTCFERRQPNAEVSVNFNLPPLEIANFGRTVASGGGWHRIGDNQETILNSVESGPAVIAAGFSSPAERSGLFPSPSSYAYGLRDVAVHRWLFPGESFITVKVGNLADGPDGKTGNYHWYYFNQETEVCTEEWVHGNGDPQTPNFLGK